MIAKEVISALRDKHAADVFVSECKNGSSYGGGLLKLDAIAIKPSYAHPLIIGYEVKVNRNDFLTDKKWHEYLDYCNEFYFVCPPHLIEKNEVSDLAGLMWVSSTGNRVYIKKKAPYRSDNPGYQNELLKYILFSRIDKVAPQKSKAEYWKEYLKNKEENSYAGREIRRIINSKLTHEQRYAETNLKYIKSEEENIKKFREFILDKFGIRLNFEFEWERKMKEYLQLVPSDLIAKLESVSVETKRLVDKFNELNKTTGEGCGKGELYG